MRSLSKKLMAFLMVGALGGWLYLAGAAVPNAFAQSRPRSTSVFGLNIAPASVSVSGTTAPQFACTRTDGPCTFYAGITAANAGASVSAFLFQPTNNLDASDLVFRVADHVGGALFSVDKNASTYFGGALNSFAGAAPFLFYSNATDAYTSSTLAAFQLRATSLLTASDLVFAVYDNGNARLLGLDGNGSLKLSGRLESPATSNLGLFSNAPDSFTSGAIPAVAIVANEDLTNTDLLLGVYRNGSTLVYSIDEQGIVNNPSGFSAGASSSLTGGSNFTMQGGGTSNGIFNCGNSTGDRCLFRNQIGASAASNTVAAFQFEQENAALASGDLFMSMKDEGTTIWKIDKDGDVTMGADASDASLSFTSGGAVGSTSSSGTFMSWSGTTRAMADGSGFRIPTKLYFSPHMPIIAADGAGTAAALTLAPATSHVQITCNDTDGCNITMDEAGSAAVNGNLVTITNVSANVCNFADTAGLSELAGAFAMGQYDMLTLQYVSDRWVEVSRSNN